jgi:hypothetical protein
MEDIVQAVKVLEEAVVDRRGVKNCAFLKHPFKMA